MELKNHWEIINELEDKIIQLEIEKRAYQTDIYLYVDEDGNGRLVEFENVGGNGYLDDDHIVVYTDLEHHEDVWDYLDDTDEIAFALDMSVEELDRQASEWGGIGYYGIRGYVASHPELMQKCTDAMNDLIRECIEFRSIAEFAVLAAEEDK